MVNTESDNMTGSDKKEQKLASNEFASGGAAPLLVQDPDVSAFVIKDDPLGLIPRAKLDTDQKTTIATWDGSLPTNPARTEYFRLQVARAGSNEWTLLQEHPYVGRANPTWTPLDFIIPKEFFLKAENEGAFELRYEHENQLTAKDWSNRVPICIDKIPPNLGKNPKHMVFTVKPPIIDTSFGVNDYLEATIPLWDGDILDVQMSYGWMKDELPEKPEDMEVIEGPIPVSPGQKVRIPKAKIIDKGDGLRCGGYLLVDKAGNAILSRYELMSVALGPWPSPTPDKPKVTDDTGGELIRSDIVDGGVMVNIPFITNGKSTDNIVLHWGIEKLEPIPVGGNPPAGNNIFVPWETIWKVYGTNTEGVVDTNVSYTVFRGVEPFPSAVEIVKCNLSAPGPVNPLPDPEPGNPGLKKVTITGPSAKPDELIAADEDQEVVATIELVDPLKDKDTYQVMWNGTPIGAPYVIDITRDTTAKPIEIKLLDWDIIREAGPSLTMPVWYQLTNAAHENPEEPKDRSSVKIDFLIMKLPDAEPLWTNPQGILWCDSLRWHLTEDTFGVEYKIPPSKHMDEDDEVTVTWRAYKDFDDPKEETDAMKEETITVSKEQAEFGITWLIEPYAKHILPTYSKEAPIGKGEVTYTIKGKPVSSMPTNTEVGMFVGEGTCNVPPPGKPVPPPGKP
ncbi:hypothetical protein PS914_04922 [Pseudomonas fluorescens]|nr:hypothetical protein PS914_04922 [Pseudomonas fluorescens]